VVIAVVMVEATVAIAIAELSTVTLTNKQTPWPVSASELRRPSGRRLSAKLMPTFADRGCPVVSATDPHDSILGFLDRTNKQSPWPESASELFRPRSRRLSAKLVLTFADRGCRVVSSTDPHDSILRFLDQTNKQTNKLRGLSPRANYANQAAAACRRSYCQLLRIEGLSRSQHSASLTTVISVSGPEE
jgi:hypothetical protein